MSGKPEPVYSLPSFLKYDRESDSVLKQYLLLHYAAEFARQCEAAGLPRATRYGVSHVASFDWGHGIPDGDDEVFTLSDEPTDLPPWVFVRLFSSQPNGAQWIDSSGASSGRSHFTIGEPLPEALVAAIKATGA